MTPKLFSFKSQYIWLTSSKLETFRIVTGSLSPMIQWITSFAQPSVCPLPKSYHFMNRFMHTQYSFCALLVYYFLNATMRYLIQSHNISCQSILFVFTYIWIILPFKSVKFHIAVVVLMYVVKSYDSQSILYFFFYVLI